jgi:putative transposase
MQLVEQHVIKREDPRWQKIDEAAFASKNLYNAANYMVRQAFIFERVYLDNVKVFHLIKHTPVYKALPAKVSNLVLDQLHKNWKSYFAAVKAYHEDPSRFLGHPKLPKYKDKQKGRNILIYDIQALSKKGLRKGLIQPSKLGIEIETKQTHVAQARIAPRNGYYIVEVVYEREEVQEKVNHSLVASIDIGVNNLVALTSNKAGFIPRLVNGRPIKHVNQFYNKQREHLQKMMKNQYNSHKLDRITNKRTRRIDHYLHSASRQIIDLLIAEGIGTLIVGKNPLWKQDPTMSRKNAQQFVQIPHARFVNMLRYKAQLVGIQVIISEESYTSKASFLDLDEIPTYGKEEEDPVFSGKRTKRGMYKSSTGSKINADVNGSYNIMRKVVPNAFACNGIEGAAVHPIRLVV